MASEWPEVALGEVVQNLDSRRVPLSRRQREKRRGPFPYYGATGVMDHVDDFLFDGLHLLVAEDGSVETAAGKPFVQLVNGRFWVNNHAHVLKGASDEDTRFLYYALSTIAIRPYISGSVQAKLSQGSLNKIPVPYPNEADRCAVTNMLGALDDKIELNRRMNETLEAMARALFKSWFVDFDPVRAKAEGRDPGLPQHLADLFPDSFEESSLGDVPTGWEAETIGASVSLSRESLDPGACPDEEFDHFSLPAFDEGETPLREAGASIKSQKLLVPDGSVLVSKLNPGTPRVWLPPTATGRRQIASTEFLVCVGNERRGASREYVYCLATSAGVAEHMVTHASGTSNSHQRVRPLDFLACPVIGAPAPIRMAFTQLVRPLLDRVAVARGESLVLAALRNRLLPALISGELRVEGCSPTPEGALR